MGSTYDRSLALVRLGRPQNCRLAVIILLLLTVKFDTGYGVFAYLAVLYAALYQTVTVLNNIFDARIDKINKRRDNPLVGRSVTVKTAWRYCMFLAVSVIVLVVAKRSLVISALAAGSAVLGVAYSWPKVGLAARGFFGSLALGFYYGSLPVLFFAAATEAVVPVWRLALTIGLVTLPVILAKDYKDEKGDRAGGKNTPLVMYGARVVRIVANSSALASGLLVLMLSETLVGRVAAIVSTLAFCVVTYLLHVRTSRSTKLLAQLLTFLVILQAVFYRP